MGFAYTPNGEGIAVRSIGLLVLLISILSSRAVFAVPVYVDFSAHVESNDTANFYPAKYDDFDLGSAVTGGVIFDDAVPWDGSHADNAVIAAWIQDSGGVRIDFVGSHENYISTYTTGVYLGMYFQIIDNIDPFPNDTIYAGIRAFSENSLQINLRGAATNTELVDLLSGSSGLFMPSSDTFDYPDMRIAYLYYNTPELSAVGDRTNLWIQVDNFSVSSVPEPSVGLLIGLGLVGLSRPSRPATAISEKNTAAKRLLPTPGAPGEVKWFRGLATSGATSAVVILRNAGGHAAGE